jgi:hypothetical protein
MKTINYTSTAEFDKDKKALLKKYKSIDSDLHLFQNFAANLYHLQGIDSNSILAIPGFENEKFQLYKVVKFPCKTLKNRGVNLVSDLSMLFMKQKLVWNLSKCTSKPMTKIWIMNEQENI